MTETAQPRGVTVATILRDVSDSGAFDLELLAGQSGLERQITIPHTQKTGLALAGFDEYLHSGRVLIFGESEIRYLERMDPSARTQALRRLFMRDLPCVMITGGLEGPRELAVESERGGVPLLRTALPTPVAIARLTSLLEDQLAPREIRHGVLMDILGLGLALITQTEMQVGAGEMTYQRMLYAADSGTSRAIASVLAHYNCAPIAGTDNRTRPAIRIMHHPITQMTPASSYSLNSKLNVQARRKYVSSRNTSHAPRVSRNRERCVRR